jgi:hypothetical protein
MGKMSSSQTSSPVPSAARIYDYLSGGSFHFPVDRDAADFMVSLVPSVPKWLRMLRAFLQKAAQQLWASGMTHFVDFGSGLPSNTHVHAVLPNARVVYVDSDPYVVQEGRRMLVDSSNTLYLQGDVLHARDILDRPEVSSFLGGTRRIAFGLSGLSVFFTPAEFNSVFRTLYDWSEPGSKVYTNYETKAPHLNTPPLQQFVDMLSQAGGSYHFYTLEDCYTVSEPWTLTSPSLLPLSEFLGMPEGYITEQEREGVQLEFYGAILEKP